MLFTGAIHSSVGDTPIARAQRFSCIAVAMALLCIVGAVANYYLRGNGEVTIALGSIAGVALTLGITERVLLWHWINQSKEIHENGMPKAQPGFWTLLKVLLVAGVAFGIGSVVAQSLHAELGGVIFFAAAAGICLISALLMALAARNKQKAKEFWDPSRPFDVNVLYSYAQLDWKKDFAVYLEKYRRLLPQMQGFLDVFTHGGVKPYYAAAMFNKGVLGNLEALHTLLSSEPQQFATEIQKIEKLNDLGASFLNWAIVEQLPDDALATWKVGGTGNLVALLALLSQEPHKYSEDIALLKEQLAKCATLAADLD